MSCGDIGVAISQLTVERKKQKQYFLFGNANWSTRMTDLPTRIPLSRLEEQKELFLQAMGHRGFVVLTELGDGEDFVRDMMSRFKAFCALPEEQRTLGTSKKIYKSERGVPMWFCGYECSDMRECFRVSTGMMDIGCWPSNEFENSWRILAFFLRNICDRCLSLALDRQISPPADASDDKSVSYAVFYPNNRGGQQVEGINIKANSCFLHACSQFMIFHDIQCK